MCGIVGGVAERDVTAILMEALKRLEYRGYDSAGIVVLDEGSQFLRHRVKGKVQELNAAVAAGVISGVTGIAHTRWATHGIPSENNAHPHISNDAIAMVHNGIIENHEKLRARLIEQGYTFASETDSETIVHLIHSYCVTGMDLLTAVRQTVKELEGHYALAVIANAEPNRLVAVRSGCPLAIGLGIGENFVASDSLALLPVTQRFIYLEEGDIVDLHRDSIQIYDKSGNPVERPAHTSSMSRDAVERGNYRHFMQKEIFEQPQAIAATLQGRLGNHRLLDTTFGQDSTELFARVKHVRIVACGTSYHAALVARNLIEETADISCQVEVASEYRYRTAVINPDSLYVTISQSGETADALAALRLAKTQGYLATLAICNVAETSMVREADLVLLTRAGAEIGVASTKAFTTQLVALLMLTLALGRGRSINSQQETKIVDELISLPRKFEEILNINGNIQALAASFSDKFHALFLGRGLLFPIALEGALKLKEISYIHAEAYPAGELKHGPLALVDKDMPVVAVVCNDGLVEKIKSNLEEVQARGGKLIVFADETTGFHDSANMKVITIPAVSKILAPIVYTIPMQLLAYHVAVIKGTDVDQPRNLAKSVTVE